ncbi:MAG: hypothetical protein NTX00_00720 [Candidatus Parcubacteria bacterium]|nr:hypothetical protein [Candidatus Parcubacteria bacterium]
MKIQIKTNLVLVIVLFWSISLIFALVSAKSSSETKEDKIFISEPTQTGSFFIAANLSNGNDVNQNEIVSNVLRANFPFNALYAHWSFKDQNQNTNFQLYLMKG